MQHRPFDLTEDVVRRFWAKVAKGDGCWLWTASTNEHGYGQLSVGRRPTKAHRISWVIAHGDPGELAVLHHCDNPPCVNPHHLFLGTQADNLSDARAKGKKVCGVGERHGKSVLTEAQVVEIRRIWANRTLSGGQLARRFGLSRNCIYAVVTNRSWRHIHG